MKLITLNIWGGKIFEPLKAFIEEHAKDVDVFCFQEMFHTETDVKEFGKMGVRANIYSEIKNILPDFQDFYAPAQDGYGYDGATDFSISFGLAMFIRKDINIESHEDIFVFRGRNTRLEAGDNATIGRNLEHVVLIQGGEAYSIFNLHGLWNGMGKSDTEDRLKQSENAKEFMKKYARPKTVLCGDFNLMPDTESLAILESGMKNLVKEHNVTSTRSSFYDKPLKFADYILVSPDIQVKDFKVLQDEVSDHLPLYIEFN